MFIGVEYLTQSEELYYKVKQTNIERYGFEVCSKNDSIKYKQEQTNIKNMDLSIKINHTWLIFCTY